MYKMHIVDQISKQEFDISSLVHDIEHTTSLYGQPGKLTFLIEKDPNDILQISCGSLVQFWCDDFPVFYGYIFKIGTDRTECYKVTAYDQMRYLQNHDYLLLKDMSLVDVFNKICNALKIENKKILGKAKTSVIKIKGEKHFADTSYFDILKYCIDQSNVEQSNISNVDDDGKFIQTYDVKSLNKTFQIMFFIRDNFGTLELNDIESNVKYRRINNDEGKSKLGWYGGKLVGYREDLIPQLEPLIIGDESLLTDYKYELDIDKETYNEIYVMNTTSDGKSEKTEDGRYLVTSDGKRLGVAEQDNSSIKKYGLLRKIQNVKNAMDEAKLKEYAKLALKVYSSPSRTMKLEALGFNGINAGDGFLLRLKKLGIESMVYVLSATHRYNADLHTMTLEVSTADNMSEVLK